MTLPPLVALTGATGFIGRHLLRELPRHGFRVRALLRRPAALAPEATGAVVGDLTRPGNLAAALAGVAAVVHSAGLAHAMSGLPEDDHRALNTEATLALARAAARAGARRFVFLSSVRAQAGASAAGVLTEEDPAAPTDAYGRSKRAAEEGLAELGASLGLDWVALRPVLVYGAGARGNVAALVALARRPWPLPALAARRSLLAVENLAAAVATVLAAPGPLARPFLVADPGSALRVGEMIAALRAGLGRPPGLVPVPGGIVAGALRALGRGEMAARLSHPLVVDPGALTRLGWTAPIGTRAGLMALARDWPPGDPPGRSGRD